MVHKVAVAVGIQESAQMPNALETTRSKNMNTVNGAYHLSLKSRTVDHFSNNNNFPEVLVGVEISCTLLKSESDFATIVDIPLPADGEVSEIDDEVGVRGQLWI